MSGDQHLGGLELERIRSVLLLGGSGHRTALSAATGRSILSLPLADGLSFLEHWARSGEQLATELDREDLPIRIFVGRTSVDCSSVETPTNRARVRFESDPKPFRGTGGLLRDVAEAYDDEDLLLVANAAQVLVQPLPKLVYSMASTGGDVCVVSHLDGTPSGLMLIKCRCLRDIAPIGFIDMKEQALPAISKKYRASVVYREVPSGLPVRSLENYIGALSWYHRHQTGSEDPNDPFSEHWSSSFSIIEPGAEVEEGAHLHDAVVLSGGLVERDAFVARSIVCPEARVTRRRTIVNELVTA